MFAPLRDEVVVEVMANEILRRKREPRNLVRNVAHRKFAKRWGCSLFRLVRELPQMQSLYLFPCSTLALSDSAHRPDNLVAFYTLPVAVARLAKSVDPHLPPRAL